MNKPLFNSTIRYLSRRPRSTKEVKDYLLKKIERKPIRRRNGTVFIPRKLTPEKEMYLVELKEQKKGEIEEILAKLQELKFLNDMEFARWWAENRTRSRPKGWRVIQMELQQKGVDKEIVKELNERIKNEGAAVFHGEFARDERQIALEVAEKKMKQLRGLERQVIYRRLGGFLGRRGFDLDIIRSVIDEVLKKSV